MRRRPGIGFVVGLVAAGLFSPNAPAAGAASAPSIVRLVPVHRQAFDQDPTCSVSGFFGAQILTSPVHVGQRVGVDAEVGTQRAQGQFSPGCRLTDVHAVVTFADGSTLTVATSDHVAGGGHTKYFTKRVVVAAGYLTDDPDLGEIFRISVSATALCRGVEVGGTVTYTVAATA